jgi:hypothetical protein
MSFISGTVGAFQGATSGMYANAEVENAPVPPPPAPTVDPPYVMELNSTYTCKTGEAESILFDEILSPSTDFTYSAAVLTCTTTGLYEFTGTVYYRDAGGAGYVSLRLNTAGVARLNVNSPLPETSLIVNGVFQCSAGEEIVMSMHNSTGATISFGKVQLQINATPGFEEIVGTQLVVRRVA